MRRKTYYLLLVPLISRNNAWTHIVVIVVIGVVGRCSDCVVSFLFDPDDASASGSCLFMVVVLFCCFCVLVLLFMLICFPSSYRLVFGHQEWTPWVGAPSSPLHLAAGTLLTPFPPYKIRFLPTQEIQVRSSRRSDQIGPRLASRESHEMRNLLCNVIAWAQERPE